jgi:RimJ/RimL family protein N-acetyltransferase
VVRLESLAAEHATWLGEFLVSDDWPFHAGSVDRDLVTERLRHGYYDGPGRATFIVTDGAQQVGLVRVDDLNDLTATFDLRVAAAHRGRGHGTAALRELAR